MTISDEATEKPTRKIESGKARKRLIWGGAAMIVALVVGAGMSISGILHSPRQVANESANAQTPLVLDVPDIVTNLDVGNQRARFIKLHVRLLLSGSGDRAIAERDMPQITDAIQTYLRAVTTEDLDGPEGTYRLRSALLNRIALLVAPVQVNDILFAQLLVQ